jgi:peptide/nickel transport system substrate-binding protein
VAGAVFDRLISRDFDMNFFPDLAKSMPTISPDGLTVDFDLVENAAWHDGEPFTSDDVLFTFNEASPKVYGPFSDQFGEFESVTAPDKYSVTFKLKQPNPDFLTYLSQVQGVCIVPKHLLEGVDLTQSNSFDTQPVGTGPFKFKEWKKGASITVEKNPNYFMAGKPHLDRIIYKVIQSDSAAIQAYKTGDLDYLWYVGYSAANELKNWPNTLVAAPDAPTLPNWKWQFNLNDPILKKKEVRQALYYGTNQQDFLPKVFYGYGTLLTGPLANASFMSDYYNPDVQRYPYDVSKANKMLDDAGYPRDSTGKRFTLSNKLPNFDPFIAQSTLWRDQLSLIGVDLVNTVQEDTVWLEDVYTTGKFQIDTVNYYAGPTPTDALGYLQSKNINKGYFLNNMGYSNATVDDLMERQRTESDKTKRVQMIREVQRIVMEDPPEYYMICLSPLLAWPTWFHGMPIPVNNPAQMYLDVWTEKPR